MKENSKDVREAENKVESADFLSKENCLEVQLVKKKMEVLVYCVYDFFKYENLATFKIMGIQNLKYEDMASIGHLHE